jgi:hypothetical protein
VFASRWPVAASEKSSHAFLATAKPPGKGRKAAPSSKMLTAAMGAKKPKKQKVAASRGSKLKGGQGVSIGCSGGAGIQRLGSDEPNKFHEYFTNLIVHLAH